MLPIFQHILVNPMQSNNLNTFPSNFAEYVANKPASVSNYAWLFDRTNPFYFPYWVSVLINLIHRLSILRSFTFFTQKALALMANKSDRTLRDVLQRLVDIEVLQVRVIKKNKQYKVNWGLLRSNLTPNNNNSGSNTETSAITSAILEENFVINLLDLIDYSNDFEPTIRDCNSNYIDLNHQHSDDFSTDNLLSVNLQTENLPLSDPIAEVQNIRVEEKEITANVASPNNDHLTKLDLIELEIKTRFEDLTGKTLNLKKNRKPLSELKKMFVEVREVVILAFKNAKDYVAQTNNRIYSLSYIVTVARNLLNPKANAPKVSTPNKSENRAYSSIGGDLSKYVAVAATPEQRASQLELDKKSIETEERNNKLRDYFFKALPENEQIDLINQKKEQLKNDALLWDKLKGFYPKALIQFCIDKIKDDLLEGYLVHQEFLGVKI